MNVSGLYTHGSSKVPVKVIKQQLISEAYQKVYILTNSPSDLLRNAARS